MMEDILGKTLKKQQKTGTALWWTDLFMMDEVSTKTLELDEVGRPKLEKKNWQPAEHAKVHPGLHWRNLLLLAFEGENLSQI